jgi:hypothetical protein
MSQASTRNGTTVTFADFVLFQTPASMPHACSHAATQAGTDGKDGSRMQEVPCVLLKLHESCRPGVLNAWVVGLSVSNTQVSWFIAQASSK